MIPLRAHAGRRVCVLSLEGAGLTAARALQAGGAEVTVWDREPARRAEAEAAGLVVEEPTTRDWSDLAALVVGDERLLEEDPAPRLIDLGRALDLPILTADAALAEGYGGSQSLFMAALGRQARAALDVTRHLLRENGRRVLGPQPPATLRDPAPGSVLLSAFKAPPEPRPTGLCLLNGAGATSALRPLMEGASGPVVLSADDPAVRRLSVASMRRALLVSGRSTLSRGVFAAGGRLFDALDGRARQAAVLGGEDGLAGAHPLALAAGYGLARGLGVPFEAARDGLSTYLGCPGHGARLSRLGPLVLTDWSSAQDPHTVLDALSAAGPAIWLAGPSVDPKIPALLEAGGKIPVAAIFTGDRRRARRKLARLCPVHVERDLTSAAAMAVHAGVRAGPGAVIIYAPGGPAPNGAAQDMRTAFDALLDRARQGDAA